MPRERIEKLRRQPVGHAAAVEAEEARQLWLETCIIDAENEDAVQACLQSYDEFSM